MDLGFDIDEQLEKLANVPKTVRLAAVVAALLAERSAPVVLLHVLVPGTTRRAGRHKLRVPGARSCSASSTRCAWSRATSASSRQEVADLERELDAGAQAAAEPQAVRRSAARHQHGGQEGRRRDQVDLAQEGGQPRLLRGGSPSRSRSRAPITTSRASSSASRSCRES